MSTTFPAPPRAPSLVGLALVQVVGASALRARVPSALARGEAMLAKVANWLAAMNGGELTPSSARGWLYRFRDTDGAIRFALRLQSDALEIEWPATLLVRPEAAEERSLDGRLVHRGLRPRIAVHVGQIEERLPQLEGEISAEPITVGPGVSHVARIVAAAHGGQVLVSEEAFSQLRGEISAAVSDLGAHVLVGVEGESRLVQLLPTSLSARTFSAPGTQSARRSNVPPTEETSLGRHGDLAAISELLGLGVRAVSLVGPAGVGKSRLIRHFAQARATDARFPGGVWSCRLEQPTLGSLCRAISWAMRIPLDGALPPTTSQGQGEADKPIPDISRESWPGSAIEQLGHAFAARGPLLLVLDGLGDPSPEVLSAIDLWLRTAPRLTTVMSVARSLKLRGEVTYEVHPLAVSGKDSGRHAEAIRIYANHARGIDEDFSVDNPVLLGELVTLVGGLPLSLRLLAGIVDRLPPAEQLQRLKEGSLREDLLPSILDLLDPEEWPVLVACSALPGSFDVTLLDDLGTGSLAVISRLERRGLLRAQQDFGAPQMQRYVVEHPVRELVLARMPEEERLALKERRAQRLVSVCEPLSRSAHAADRTEVVAQIAMEWDGLCEAIEIGLDPSREDPQAVELALRAALVLEPVFRSRGPLAVTIEILDAVLRRCDAILGSDPLLQLRVLALRGAELRRAGRSAAAVADIERALSIALRWSDREGSALCNLELGRALYDSGLPSAAEAALRRATDDAVGLRAAEASSVLGAVLLSTGQLEESRELLISAISAMRMSGAYHLFAPALTWLAILESRRGRFDEARSCYLDSIANLRRTGALSSESRASAGLGIMELHLGRVEEARTSLTDAVELARWHGDRSAESNALRSLAILAMLLDQLDTARERLFEAMAIDRDRGDRLSEALDCGFVAIAQHIGDQIESARESYARALAMLEEAKAARMIGTFAGWYAALEAERLDADAARRLFERARRAASDLSDVQLGEVLRQLEGALDAMEAELAERAGDSALASQHRARLEMRWAELRSKTTAVPIEARLANERVRVRWSFKPPTP